LNQFDHIGPYKYLTSGERDFTKIRILFEEVDNLIQGEFLTAGHYIPILVTHPAMQVTALSRFKDYFRGERGKSRGQVLPDTIHNSSLLNTIVKISRC
jgi:hypothetical protein